MLRRGHGRVTIFHFRNTCIFNENSWWSKVGKVITHFSSRRVAQIPPLSKVASPLPRHSNDPRPFHGRSGRTGEGGGASGGGRWGGRWRAPTGACCVIGGCGCPGPSWPGWCPRWGLVAPLPQSQMIGQLSGQPAFQGHSSSKAGSRTSVPVITGPAAPPNCAPATPSATTCNGEGPDPNRRTALQPPQAPPACATRRERPRCTVPATSALTARHQTTTRTTRHRPPT